MSVGTYPPEKTPAFSGGHSDWLCSRITTPTGIAYHLVQAMLANITIDLRAISKNRTIAAAKINVMKLLYFKIIRIIYFATYITLDGGYLSLSFLDLSIVNHYVFSRTTLRLYALKDVIF
jgi:hypothetical protein